MAIVDASDPTGYREINTPTAENPRWHLPSPLSQRDGVLNYVILR
jgi:hypothetical protein